MARKGMGTQSLQLVQDATMDRLAAQAVSKVGPLIPPWALLGVEAVAGSVSHAAWGDPTAVTWAAVGSTLGAVALSALTWAITHQRRMLGRMHSTITAAAAGGWFTVCTITGITASPTAGTLFFGGGLLALTWNVRSAIRSGGGQGDGTTAHGGDALAGLFDQAKASFGLKGAQVRTTEVEEHKIRGQMQLPPGERTAEDAQRSTPYIESGMKLPPGSVIVSPDEDDASRAHVTVSDPRLMKRPIPWPGPSAPGGSIGEPLRVGMYQDAAPVLHRFTGHYLQIQGMIGSGKSIGGAWNYLAEIVSRSDTAVFAVDLAKDDQTFGPLKPALHRFETTVAGVARLIRQMHAAIPQRTKWLAAHGYQKWVPGCGLAYWYLWLEEAPKVFEALSSADRQMLEEIVKELRSAGGSVVLSLQRADYTQVDTIVRSQMGKMCFGVGDPDDAKFGTSARQRKAGVNPQEWENHQPGMAYLDVPGIPATHYAMPLRTYSWGATDTEANTAMAAHAAAYPAEGKPADEFTANLTDLPSAPAAHDAEDRPAADPDSVPDAAPADDPRAGTRPEIREDAAELLAAAAQLVISTGRASAAWLQSRLHLPREDCLRLLEALERHDVIGAAVPGSENREVLIGHDDPAAHGVIDQLRTDGDAAADYLQTPDPDQTITAGPADDITDPTPEEDFTTPDRDHTPMSPAAARGLVTDWLRHRAAIGDLTFTAGDDDLTAVRERAGMKRPWTYKVLKSFVREGVLTADTSGPTTRYTIDPDRLDPDRVPAAA